MSLTAEEATNLYLYGTTTRPIDLVSDSLIRLPGTGPTQIDVDIDDSMENGPGRFVKASMFESIREFLSGAGAFSAGTYLESEVNSRLDVPLSEWSVNMEQWAYDDGSPDYAERVYVWGGVAFEIDEQTTRFVVNADGTRYIENLRLIPLNSNAANGPVIPEEFDFISGSRITQQGNDRILRPTVRR
jgi:hypothetical protein